ncbi:MAG TPA: TetR/AcrR family transcriptional regulator [Actinomycetota bacterium]|nr:TetR/AcrR family transcriptional regulator [Actinomycetota bacterium]
MAAIEKGRLADAGADLVPHTSERIEQAALELFYESGFNATTMREIALACGLTPGALYNHFASKDQLLGQLLVDIHRQLTESLEAAVAAAGEDPVSRVHAYCRAHALFHTTYITEARVANREIASLTPEHLEQVVSMRTRATNQLRALIQEGVEAGVFEVPHVEAVANLILTMAISIAGWYRPGGALDREQMADLDAEMALRMLTCTTGGRER